MFHFDTAKKEYPDLHQDLGNDAFMFLFSLITSTAMRETLRNFDDFLASVEVDLKDRFEKGGGLEPSSTSVVVETLLVPVAGLEQERKQSVDTTGSKDFSIRELYEGSLLQNEFMPRDQRLNARQFLDLVRNIQAHPKLAVYLNSLVTYFEEQISVARSTTVPQNRPYLDQGWVEFKKFVSNLANDFDFEPLDNYLTFYSHVIQKDQDFAEVASMWIEFIYKLSDPKYLDSEQAIYRCSNMVQQTQKHLYDNYRKETLGTINQIHLLIEKLLDDPVSNQMVRLAENVFNDMFLPK
jgi:hypothetical protein